MHHGGAEELQRMGAKRQGVPFLHGHGSAFVGHAVKELREHLDGLCRCHKLHLGPLFHSPGNEGRMVRFHVMDHKITGDGAAEGLLERCLPLFSAAGIHGVHDGCLVVLYEIRIVGHALFQDVLAFKEVQGEVIGPDIKNGISDFFHDGLRLFPRMQKYKN